jgi:hypothetical protein
MSVIRKEGERRGNAKGKATSRHTEIKQESMWGRDGKGNIGWARVNEC